MSVKKICNCKMTCDCNVIHEDKVRKALANRPDADILDKISKLFIVIGEPTRTKILWTLDKNEMCVCDIANVLNMTKSSISHQLAVLKSAGVVEARREGKEVYYRLDDEHISKLYEICLEHIEHKLESEVLND